MAHKDIYYSDKYFDEQYEYRYETAAEHGLREAGGSPAGCPEAVARRSSFLRG